VKLVDKEIEAKVASKILEIFGKTLSEKDASNWYNIYEEYRKRHDNIVARNYVRGNEIQRIRETIEDIGKDFEACGNLPSEFTSTSFSGGNVDRLFGLFEEIRQYEKKLKEIDIKKRDKSILNPSVQLEADSEYQKAYRMMLASNSWMMATVFHLGDNERPKTDRAGRGHANSSVIHLANLIMHDPNYPRINASDLNFVNCQVFGGFLGLTRVGKIEFHETILQDRPRRYPTSKELNNPYGCYFSYLRPTTQRPRPGAFEKWTRKERTNENFVDSRRLRMWITGPDADGSNVYFKKGCHVGRGVELYGSIKGGELSEQTTFRANCIGLEKFGVQVRYPQYFGGLITWLKTYGFKINDKAADSCDAKLKDVLFSPATWPFLGGTLEEFRTRYYKNQMIDYLEIMVAVTEHQAQFGVDRSQVWFMNAETYNYIPYGLGALFRKQGQAGGLDPNKQIEMLANTTQAPKRRNLDGPVSFFGWIAPGWVQSIREIGINVKETLTNPRNIQEPGSFKVRNPHDIKADFDSSALPGYQNFTPGELFSHALRYLGSPWQARLDLPDKLDDKTLPPKPKDTPDPTAADRETIGRPLDPGEDPFAEAGAELHGRDEYGRDINSGTNPNP
jgi:hypothetical protein